MSTLLFFQEVLRLSHDRSLNKYASIDEEDDFQVWTKLIHSEQVWAISDEFESF